MRYKRISLAVLGAFVFVTATATAAADLCPSKTVRIVVANPAGGVGDLVARVLGDKVSAEIGQAVIVENKPGASTTIGTDAVAKAKPDGCTILSLTASGVVVTEFRANLPYSLQRDFAPIIAVGSFPMVMAVPAESKLNTFADVVATAKSKDGITYASGGAGTLAHLSSVRLLNEVNGTGNHIPFKGNADAIQALQGNQVQLFFPSTAEALSLAKSGKVRLLAVTSEQRVPALPNVPTMKELGFADFTPRLWFAFLAPAKTPPGTVKALEEAFAKAASDRAVNERLMALGFAPEIKDAAALSVFMNAEAARWRKVIKDNKIVGE
jgi:tripartite-type tricarboxylate transporter receptor subunit TctC